MPPIHSYACPKCGWTTDWLFTFREIEAGKHRATKPHCDKCGADMDWQMSYHAKTPDKWLVDKTEAKSE